MFRNPATVRVAAVVLAIVQCSLVGAGGNRRRNQRTVIRQDRPARQIISAGSVQNQRILTALAVELAEQQQLTQGLQALGLGAPYTFQGQRFGQQPYSSGTTGYVAGQDPFRRAPNDQAAELVDRQQRTAERLLETQEQIAQANLRSIEAMRKPAAAKPVPPAEGRSVFVDAANSCARCHNPDKEAGGLVLDGSRKIDDETLSKAIGMLVAGKMPKTPAGDAVPLEGEQLQRALLNVARLAVNHPRGEPEPEER